MVNRDRHDIVMQILEKTKTKKKKTELMRDVGLSYLQSKQYLDMLVEHGFLKIDENRHFRITQKGLEFLDKCADCFLCHWHKQKAR